MATTPPILAAPPPIAGARPRPPLPPGPPGGGPDPGVRQGQGPQATAKLQQAGRLILEVIQETPALGPRLTDVLRQITEAATEALAQAGPIPPPPTAEGPGGMPPGPDMPPSRPGPGFAPGGLPPGV